jgi:hypothetical protein
MGGILATLNVMKGFVNGKCKESLVLNRSILQVSKYTPHHRETFKGPVL